MSLAEVPPPDDEWGDGPASYAPGNAPSTNPGGGRTPPQDMAAEQSVLGAMLISKDAIADVLETVRGVDYYRPAHESIHDAILDLYGRGEPADMVTVADELGRRGELARIGGAPYLHTLAANVPIAANAGFYAEIVREKAILRRLVDAGTKIVQIGYAGEGEVDNIVDVAQAEVYSVTDRRRAEDYAPLSDIVNGVLDEIEAIESRDAGIYGVPTGFADLDELTNGLHKGQMIIVAARPAMGKALALDTPLATPTGWTTMGEVQVGDQLYDARGRATTVVAATDVLRDRPCYEVEFSDGSTIVADAQHQWLTETRAARKSKWAAERNYNRARNQNVFRRGRDHRGDREQRPNQQGRSRQPRGSQCGTPRGEVCRTSQSRPTFSALGSVMVTAPVPVSPVRPTRFRCTSKASASAARTGVQCSTPCNFRRGSRSSGSARSAAPSSPRATPTSTRAVAPADPRTRAPTPSDSSARTVAAPTRASRRSVRPATATTGPSRRCFGS